MRKLSYFAALVVAMVAVSCAKEIDAPVADGTVKFTASFDSAASKAVLKPGAEESKVEWEAGDQVSILAAGANYLYAAQTPGASTTLTTEATDVPAEFPSSTILVTFSALTFTFTRPHTFLKARVVPFA